MDDGLQEFTIAGKVHRLDVFEWFGRLHRIFVANNGSQVPAYEITGEMADEIKKHLGVEVSQGESYRLYCSILAAYETLKKTFETALGAPSGTGPLT